MFLLENTATLKFDVLVKEKNTKIFEAENLIIS